MGWQDTSVPFRTQKTPFNERYRTPSMERLARQGIKFTQAHACTVSSPSRISLLTGMNAARHRVTNWTLEPDGSQESKHPVLDLPPWNVSGVSQDPSTPRAVRATPLPRILQDHGYFTIHCGKAHFGAIGTPGANPLNLGFNINIAGHAAGAPQSYQGLKNFGYDENASPGNIWGVPGLSKYHGRDFNLTEALPWKPCWRWIVQDLPESLSFCTWLIMLCMPHWNVIRVLRGKLLPASEIQGRSIVREGLSALPPLPFQVPHLAFPELVGAFRTRDRG